MNPATRADDIALALNRYPASGNCGYRLLMAAVMVTFSASDCTPRGLYFSIANYWRVLVPIMMRPINRFGPFKIQVL